MNRWTTVEFIHRHAFMHRLFHAYRENSEVDVTSRERMLEIEKPRNRCISRIPNRLEY